MQPMTPGMLHTLLQLDREGNHAITVVLLIGEPYGPEYSIDSNIPHDNHH